MYLTIVSTLILLKVVFKIILEGLNQKELRKYPDVPELYQDFIDEETYLKAVAYTKEKSRLSQLTTLYGGGVLLFILNLGVMAWYQEGYYSVVGELMSPVWSDSIFLFSFLFLYSLVSLPFSLYSTFGLEQKFGFNTMTIGLWLKDFVKSFILSAVLSIPLIALILFLLDEMGTYWWVWAWGAVIGFQFLMQILYPKLIIPLFNKLTPLPEGELQEQILDLAKKLKFGAKEILMMDGSKRSKHSNAFFTGIGKSRRVVFFDTLVEQLNIDEMKAVFAHEIGHYKRKHILKGIIISTLMTFFTFFLIDFLRNYQGFNQGFGMPDGELICTILIFSLFGGTVTFWMTPLSNIFSRKNEYEADAYAKVAVGEGKSLVDALKKLYKENLSNLTPHPIYSFFYYSHPTVFERERKLKSTH